MSAGALDAGGGTGAPDERVLRALTTPIIGQFDPSFTAIMDDVMRLARQVFLTHNARCFPVSGLARAGVEAVLNTLIEPGDRVCVLGGSPAVSDMAGRYGAAIADRMEPGVRLIVAPHLDPQTAEPLDVPELAQRAHAAGAALVLDTTATLGGLEVHTDAWGVDVCVAGVDACLGAPPGLTLVTYTDRIEAQMRARAAPPPTSYLDLLQLQAYWSPERLNHHTAPTTLVYGLREALRLVLDEGLESRWHRHQQVASALAAGLHAVGLTPRGTGPMFILGLPPHVDAEAAHAQLRSDFGVHVGRAGERSWRIGLLAGNARMDAVLRLLSAIEQVVGSPGPAVRAARQSASGLA